MKKLLILLVLILLCGCSKQEVSKPLAIKLKDDKVEIYSKVYLHDLIVDSNAKIVSKNILIDTTKLGKRTYELELELDGKDFVNEIKVNVVDTTPPLIISGVNKTVEIGYENNLSDLIMFADNYDRNPICTVEGEYDTNKIGVYNIKYNVSDSSKNITTQDATLHVVNKKDITPSITVPVSFSDILAIHKTENTEVGIDVSKWQGDIDFEQVKKAGASFVIMRIGVQTEQNGELGMDSYYKENIKKAKKAGLKVGVYLYSIATSVKESKAHANWVLKELDDEKLDLPIVFDWESWSNFSKYNLSLFDINNIANTFIFTIENNGYTGALYSSKTYLEYIWNTKIFHSVWLAHYIDQTTYEGEYTLWQLTDSGNINGIDGPVDINIMYKK